MLSTMASLLASNLTAIPMVPLRLRHGTSILALLLLLPYFIIAQDDVGKLQTWNCLQSPLVRVFSVYLTCDSAGSYYYGKSSYRDSATCKYGDTATVNAYVELIQDFSYDPITVSIDSGVYGVLEPTIESITFCTIATLSTSTNDDDDTDDNHINNDDYAAVCPAAGFYSIKTSFIVSSFEVDQNLHYVPDLRLLFYNSTSTVVGCAQTGTIAHSNHASMHAEMGMMALGVALLVLGTCFGLMLYLTYRRKKRIEQEMLDKKLKLDAPYVRTTSRGRVVRPYKGGSNRSYSSSSDV